MIRWLFSSKLISIPLDIIGIFSLASFLFATIYLSFLVEILPQCYFTNALIPFVECGNGFSGEFFISFLVMSFIILPFLASLRILYRTLKRIIWCRKSYSSKERRTAYILLFLIFLPTLSTGAFKYYLAPPQSSERIIKIDLWYSTLSIQRNYLSKWSLRPIERPPSQATHSRKKTHPFATIIIPSQIIEETAPEDNNITIKVSPKYYLTDSEHAFQEREWLLDQEIGKTYYKDKLPIYGKAEILKNWIVYKVRADINTANLDIYVSKNPEQKIDHLLQCTPDTQCVTPRNKKSRHKNRPQRCLNEDECASCARVCTTLGSETFENNISFTFPKSDINTYFDLYPKVIDFVESRLSKKNSF